MALIRRSPHDVPAPRRPLSRVAGLLGVLALLLSLLAAAPAQATDDASSTASDPAPAAVPNAVSNAVSPARAGTGLPLPPRCLKRPGPCTIGPQRASAPVLLLWGDSHAWQQLRGVRLAAQSAPLHVNLVISVYGGCPPMDPGLTPQQVKDAGACDQTNARAISYLERLLREGRDVRVLLGSGWEISRYALHPLPGTATGWRQPTSPSVANAARLGKRLTPRLFRTLGRLRAPVDVIGQMTTVPTNAPACEAGFEPYACDLPRSAALSHFRENLAHIRSLRRSLARPGVIVQPSRGLCDTRTCTSVIDGRSVYANAAHVTRPAVARLAPLFAPVVQRLVRAARR